MFQVLIFGDRFAPSLKPNRIPKQNHCPTNDIYTSNEPPTRQKMLTQIGYHLIPHTTNHYSLPNGGLFFRFYCFPCQARNDDQPTLIDESASLYSNILIILSTVRRLEPKRALTFQRLNGAGFLPSASTNPFGLDAPDSGNLETMVAGSDSHSLGSSRVKIL